MVVQTPFPIPQAPFSASIQMQPPDSIQMQLDFFFVAFAVGDDHDIDTAAGFVRKFVQIALAEALGDAAFQQAEVQVADGPVFPFDLIVAHRAFIAPRPKGQGAEAPLGDQVPVSLFQSVEMRVNRRHELAACHRKDPPRFYKSARPLSQDHRHC